MAGFNARGQIEKGDELEWLVEDRNTFLPRREKRWEERLAQRSHLPKHKASIPRIPRNPGNDAAK